ncbi:hypothetical protein ACFWDG_03590 [Peribacillus sp. NPDC060186]
MMTVELLPCRTNYCRLRSIYLPVGRIIADDGRFIFLLVELLPVTVELLFCRTNYHR